MSVLVEVLSEGQHCMPCVYMEKLVFEALSSVPGIDIKVIYTKDPSGAKRFRELSKAMKKVAPVPSIFINGKLVYDSTPSAEELRAIVREYLKEEIE